MRHSTSVAVRLVITGSHTYTQQKAAVGSATNRTAAKGKNAKLLFASIQSLR
jgi:hypothetical protein